MYHFKWALGHIVILVGLLVFLAPGELGSTHGLAQEPIFQHQSQPQRNMAKPQTPCERKQSHARAGYPLCLSKLASLTYDNEYKGYYIGGGVPANRTGFFGEPRTYNEGTWGVDYARWYTCVASTWSHGRLYQGGTGQYEPDHKNRALGGQTFGKFFGNRDRRLPQQYGSHADHESRCGHQSQHVPGAVGPDARSTGH